jgi:ribosomal protein S8
MGFLDKIKGKSKEELNIERELRYRKARNAVQSYIERMETLQQRIFEQGRQAAKIGDDKFVRRQAAKYLALQERIKRGQRMLLHMDEAKLQRELVKTSGDFITFAKDISESIAEGTSTEKMAEMQLEFEKAMQQVEQIDEALSVAIEMASDGILSSKDISEKNVESIMQAMEEKTGEEEKMDERISKGVREVEEMMRKG